MTTKKPIVLFDLDGTLVSTIDLYEKAILRMMEEVNQAMTAQEFRAMYTAGKHLNDIMKDYAIDATEEDRLRQIRDAHYIDLLRTEAQWLDGAEQAFRAFNNAHTTGIITGSWKSYTDAINERLNIYDGINALVTADDMRCRMKPDPYGLILAAEKLDVDPADCIYIGDQAFDTAAAKAAGMRAVLIETAFTPPHAKNDADEVVRSLEELHL